MNLLTLLEKLEIYQNRYLTESAVLNSEKPTVDGPFDFKGCFDCLDAGHSIS